MEDDVIIYETSYWRVILNSEQSYLGRCVVVLKRECSSLSLLESNEWKDFEDIVSKLEFAFKSCFNASLFNWGCLMNNAFKDKNPKPQVHWHVRPRYSKDVLFEGEIFQDLEFGHHYSRDRKKFVSKDLLEKIGDEVKRYF